jgi:ATP-dependent Lon protease
MSSSFRVFEALIDAAKAGAKTGVGALIALSSALLKKSVRGGLVVVGEVTLGAPSRRFTTP